MPFLSRSAILSLCRVFLLMVVLALAPGRSSAQTLVADRPGALYELGEGMHFVLESASSGSASYECRFDLDTSVLASGSVSVTGGVPAAIPPQPFTSQVPGFVLCQVEINGAQPRAGAGFGVDQLGPYEDDPADFDSFWHAQLQTLAQVAIDPVVGSPVSGSYSTTYPVDLAMVDRRRVYGFVTIPDGDGPFPAILQLPAFGGSAVGDAAWFAEDSGAITMSISIHNGNPDANAYEPNDPTDRNSMYYRWAILSSVRALDYLTSLPDYDGSNLGVMGVSQGGGLSLILAGLDSRVKAVSTSNAALAEHTGYRYDRASGFPDYLKNNSQSDWDDIIAATKYYDAVRFARRFDGPSFHNISFEDDVCPPATSWSAYNQLVGEKVLLRTRDLGHSHPWNEHQVARMHFFRRHFGMAPANPWKPDDILYGADVGPDRQIAGGGSVQLSATVDLEGEVNNSWPGEWKKVSGPGAVTFSAPTSRSTSATFSAEGRYRIRFQAHDESAASSGLVHTVSDTLEVEVGEPSSELFSHGFESGSLSAWS